MTLRVGDNVYAGNKFLGVVSRTSPRNGNVYVKCNDGVRRLYNEEEISLIMSVDDVIRIYKEAVLDASR